MLLTLILIISVVTQRILGIKIELKLNFENSATCCDVGVVIPYIESMMVYAANILSGRISVQAVSNATLFTFRINLGLTTNRRSCTRLHKE